MRLMQDRPPAMPLAPGTEAFSLAARGYTPHDGAEMPAGMSRGAEPGVVFDDGTFIRQGEREAGLIDWSRVRGWKLRDYRVEKPGQAFAGKRPTDREREP